jgi:hypothetical protein
MGSKIFAVAVLETTSVMEAVTVLTIKLIAHNGRCFKCTRYWVIHVENPKVE